MVSTSGAVDLGKHIAAEFSEKNVSFMAAALAYHAFISMAPMLLLLFLLITTVGVGPENELVQNAIALLPGPIAGVVIGLLQGGPSGSGTSVIGLLVLFWGSLKLFRGLDTAFSEIYETTETNSFVDKLRDGLVVLFALAIAIVAVIASSLVLGTLTERIPFTQWATPLVLLAGLMLAFYPIYYVFPDTKVGVRDVLPGVVVAAVGWGAMQGLFQLYLSVAEPSAGGVFGGIIVIITYLYFSALVLLLGAVVNTAIGEHSMGGPGGVGRVDAHFQTERTDSFDTPQLVAYLADLRTELLAEPGTHTRTELVGSRPRPDGDIELEERSTTDGDFNQWQLTLRWTFSDDELVKYYASRTDEAASSTAEPGAVSAESGDD